MSAASDDSVNRLISNDASGPAEPLSAPDEILAVLAASHRDPFAFLGLHDWGDHEGVLRVFQPAAEAVGVVDAATGAQIGMMTPRQGRRFFDLRLTAAQTAHLREVGYRLRVAAPEGPVDLDDPYRFPPTLGELDLHLIGEGTHLRIYKRLGARPLTLDGVTGTAFAVWAPSASRVAVVGGFNGWDGRVHGMRFHPDCGVWDIFLPGVGTGACYKFEIKDTNGRTLPLKADPFGLAAEHPPRTGSVVHHPRPYPWTDDAWMARRARDQGREAPLSIYEVHLASWAREPAAGSRGGRYLNYDELGDRLIPYARGLGFTHLELLPITEYPFDGSWGYQPLGLFAPTSRHGDPVAFQRFVDRCHSVGLGVLLDWVPGHFPTDEHGLAAFDGSHLFEHADPRQGFHLDWNTLIYNFGRREVANYLLSNALFWLDRYHLDGLRVDAVASMLYLDYSRKDGEWVPNRYGGRENLEAIDFLKRLNETVYGQFPGAITIAEESTAWPAVSRPTYAGGLGFGFKWNMGWMHDTLAYFSREPIHRRWHHNHLTFGLLYAFSENFILPLSHDEVVHGKRSLIGKMAGDHWQRFANLRAYYAFMWCHPGKKLMFMGGEFAQEREWNHDQGLDWQLLEQPRHRGVQRLVSDLNRVYRTLPALHQLDGEPAGFEWVDCTDSEHSVISFLRWGRSPGTPPVLVVCNLTPVVRAGYRVGAPAPGVWREVINTDADVYGGSGVGNFGQVRAQEISWHQRPYSLRLTLPPLATLVLTPAREPEAQDSWKPDPDEAWDPGAEPHESAVQGGEAPAIEALANEAPGNNTPADDGSESVRGRESGW